MFAETPEGFSGDSNRAALIALSIAVVGERADALFPGGAELRRRCAFPERPLTLQGRADLAKHWALSAALASVLGEQAANNVGEWKELRDSLPDGTGFSFVDLAADRAGVQTALQAIVHRTARRTGKELSQATDEYMLPAAVLAAPEGLAEDTFLKGFGSLDQEGYSRAVAEIDRHLNQRRRQPIPN
jgi:hypothetical protein